MLKFIFKYARKYWLEIVIMLILTIFSAKINLELPQYTSKIISEGVAMKNMEAIYSNGFMMIGLSLIAGGLMLASIFFAARSAGGMARDLRRDTFAKIESFSMSEFGKFPVSSLLTRISNDARQFQQTFTMTMRMGIYAPIVGVGAVINVFSISASMSWIVAATVVAIISLTAVISIFAMPNLSKIQKFIDKMNLQSRQTITGLRVIRAYRKDKIEESKFDKINADSLKLNIFIDRVFSLISPFMTMISGFSLVAVAWIGSYFVANNTISIGDIFALTQYTAQVTFAFSMLSMILVFLPRMFVSLKRIREVLDMQVSVKDKKRTQRIPEFFDIEFKDVNFSYPDSEEKVLDGISFKIKQGQTVAVIGGTGSGKSTIAKLIPRFFDIDSGEITIGNINIKNFAQKDLHEIIGYAPQKAQLFSGTIRENIAYGKTNISDEQIIDALKIAQAWDFVQGLPNDLDEKVSQGGKNFSGGQKQRLSIACAIATNAPILIFDDSFSALDYKTDSLLRAELTKKTKNQTKFIVAQRVSSIASADHIIVLDDGKISAHGKHGKLLKTSDLYREIASSQLSDDEIKKQIKAFERSESAKKKGEK